MWGVVYITSITVYSTAYTRVGYHTQTIDKQI